jgi:hypothetical protein
VGGRHRDTAGKRALKWGIYDNVDHCWLGRPDEGGPRLFDTDEKLNGIPLGENAEKVARVAAQIAAHRLGMDTRRIVAKAYDVPATKVKDELPLKDTTLNVLRKLEDGTIV